MVKGGDKSTCFWCGQIEWDENSKTYMNLSGKDSVIWSKYSRKKECKIKRLKVRQYVLGTQDSLEQFDGTGCLENGLREKLGSCNGTFYRDVMFRLYPGVMNRPPKLLIPLLQRTRDRRQNDQLGVDSQRLIRYRGGWVWEQQWELDHTPGLFSEPKALYTPRHHHPPSAYTLTLTVQ